MMKSFILFSALFSAPSFGGGSAEEIGRSADDFRASHPALAERVDGMSPIVNRAGKYFFPGSDLMGHPAQVLIQDRLLDGGDPTPVVVALAYALDGEHRLEPALIAGQPAAVRAALISGYKKHGLLDAVQAFEDALVDPSMGVRLEAVRLIGYRPNLESPTLSRRLLAAIGDPQPPLRAMAARSISWRVEAGGFAAIVPLLSDGSGLVRGAAVRALGKIDPAAAAIHPGVQALKADADPQVSRAIRRVLKP
jgi:HEAT repeat protein